MGRMTLMTGGERRRRWSEEERARILAEIAEPEAVVAEVARRADVGASLVYKWQREARKGPAPVEFAPVIVAAASSSALAPAGAEKPGVIVVEVNEARVRIHAEASVALVAATLKALRA